mmetsp:Transcript_13350/g.26390  ORF Transcript_13350/g.26390 Transcript_13350/m.26390 type:complete len:93 (+) Transcript_13350:170-448(+)
MYWRSRVDLSTLPYLQLPPFPSGAHVHPERGMGGFSLICCKKESVCGEKRKNAERRMAEGKSGVWIDDYREVRGNVEEESANSVTDSLTVTE